MPVERIELSPFRSGLSDRRGCRYATLTRKEAARFERAGRPCERPPGFGSGAIGHFCHASKSGAQQKKARQTTLAARSFSSGLACQRAQRLQRKVSESNAHDLRSLRFQGSAIPLGEPSKRCSRMDSNHRSPGGTTALQAAAINQTLPLLQIPLVRLERPTFWFEPDASSSWTTGAELPFWNYSDDRQSR